MTIKRRLLNTTLSQDVRHLAGSSSRWRAIYGPLAQSIDRRAALDVFLSFGFAHNDLPWRTGRLSQPSIVSPPPRFVVTIVVTVVHALVRFLCSIAALKPTAGKETPVELLTRQPPCGRQIFVSLCGIGARTPVGSACRDTRFGHPDGAFLLPPPQ